MRLLTTENRYQPVSKRRSLGYDRRLSDRTVELLSGKGGRIRRASYADLYRDNPWVFGSIRRLARDVASLPWNVYEIDSDGREAVDLGRDGFRPESRRVARMIRRPQERTSQNTLLTSTVRDYGIYGNALWLPRLRDDEIIHIPWSRVTVELDPDDLGIVAYVVERDDAAALLGSDNRQVLLPEDVVHFGKGDDPEDPLGMSPLEPLAKSTRLMDAIHRYLRSYFANQATPSGNLKLPQGADRQAIEMVKAEVSDMYVGPENAGEVMVTTGDWQSVHDEPSHSHAVKLNELSREEVVAVLGVHPDRQGLGNERDRNSYYRDVIGPWVREIESEIDAQLLTMRDGWRDSVVVEADMSSAIRGDMKQRADTYRLLRFVYTLNELREMEGRKPIDDPRADTVYLPANETPMLPETIGDHQDGTGANDPEPNEFGDGVPAEEQRPTGNQPDADSA